MSSRRPPWSGDPGAIAPVAPLLNHALPDRDPVAEQIISLKAQTELFSHAKESV